MRRRLPPGARSFLALSAVAFQLAACGTAYKGDELSQVQARYAEVAEDETVRHNTKADLHMDRAAAALEQVEYLRDNQLLVATAGARAEMDLQLDIARREIEMAELLAQGEQTQLKIAALKQRKEELMVAALRQRKATLAAVAPEPPAAVVPLPSAAAPLTLTDVMFDFNKAQVKPEFAAPLADLAAALKENEQARLVVEGHTDGRGSTKYNRRLSEQRAVAVKTFMIKQGVPKERIVARGKGESKPIASNSTEEGRAKNRRVELAVSPENP